ncbi:unnamed protein product [Gordionus sp. m RMFG-2023]
MTAGVCGALFVGYCVYFDKKRRSDPNFKNKLREKRTKLKLEKENENKLNIPDFKDPEAMQAFFIQEVTKGEELLAIGDLENGIDHLSIAVSVCGQQKQLLKVLEQTLPPQIFFLLVQKLPQAHKKIFGSSNFSTTIAEEDVD